MSVDVIDGKYFTGCLVPEQITTTFKVYEESQPLLSIEEIRKIIDNELRAPARKRFPAGKFIENQEDTSSCNGWAGSGSLLRTRASVGLDFVRMSGDWLYSLINGGRDSGSMLDDGMEKLMSTGVAPYDLVQKKQYIYNRMSQEARQAAPRFKAFECYRVKTELGLASGLTLGFVGVVAVHASNAWSSLSNGVSRRSLGPGNHAVVCQDVALNGDKLHFDIANSWGRRWGDDGHTWNTWNDHLVEPNKYHAFYLVRGATDDPQNPAPEPK